MEIKSIDDVTKLGVDCLPEIGDVDDWELEDNQFFYYKADRIVFQPLYNESQKCFIKFWRTKKAQGGGKWNPKVPGMKPNFKKVLSLLENKLYSVKLPSGVRRWFVRNDEYCFREILLDEAGQIFRDQFHCLTGDRIPQFINWKDHLYKLQCISYDQFLANQREYINFKNVVLERKTGVIYDDYQFFIKKIRNDNKFVHYCDYELPTDEKQIAEEENILDHHIGETLFGGADSEGYIRSLLFFGCALMDKETRLALILLGKEGQEGKSKFFDFMHLCLPHNTSSAISLTDFTNPNALIQLEHSIANFSTDVEPNSMMQQGVAEMFRKIVSKDVITGKKLYVDQFTFHPQAQCFIATNAPLELEGHYYMKALQDRMEYIEIKKAIAPEEQIPNILDVLKPCRGTFILKCLKLARKVKWA